MVKFSVPEMTCGHCKKTIEEAIHRLDGGACVDVDLDNHEIALTTTISTPQILDTLKSAGYEARAI